MVLCKVRTGAKLNATALHVTLHLHTFSRISPAKKDPLSLCRRESSWTAYEKWKKSLNEGEKNMISKETYIKNISKNNHYASNYLSLSFFLLFSSANMTSNITLPKMRRNCQSWVTVTVVNTDLMAKQEFYSPWIACEDEFSIELSYHCFISQITF